MSWQSVTEVDPRPEFQSSRQNARATTIAFGPRDISRYGSDVGLESIAPLWDRIDVARVPISVVEGLSEKGHRIREVGLFDERYQTRLPRGVFPL